MTTEALNQPEQSPTPELGGAFVADFDLIPVTAPGVDPFSNDANIIFLRPELTFREDALLLDELARIQIQNAGVNMRFLIGSYQLALMRAHVADWSGPMFQQPDGNKVPCTPTNVNRLRMNNPVVQAAAAKITELTKKNKGQSPNPKLATKSGSTESTVPSSVASALDESADGIPTLP